MKTDYEVAVIGTGPAGMEAALTLKARNIDFVLFGNTICSDKISKAHMVKNYLGMLDVSGEDMANSFAKQLSANGIEICKKGIHQVFSMGDYFQLQTKTNEFYRADSVILATGVNFGTPYEGEKEFLGKGVSYCATCDGMFYREKTIAVVVSSKEEEGELDFLAGLAEKIYYFPLYPVDELSYENVEIIKEKPLCIEGQNGKVSAIVTEQEKFCVDGVFLLRENVSPAQLVVGLDMEERHIAVNRMLETNIPGCYACGDITGVPYQYIKAAGEGNVAAISAVTYLQGKKRRD